MTTKDNLYAKKKWAEPFKKEHVSLHGSLLDESEGSMKHKEV